METSETVTYSTLMPKNHSTPKSFLDRNERKTLQTLQTSPNGGGLNGGKDCSSSSVHHKDPGGHKMGGSHMTQTIYHDPGHHSGVKKSNVVSVQISRLTQTDEDMLEHLIEDKKKLADLDDSGRSSGLFDQEALDLMVNETSETYWKDLAEERRRALKETLSENQKLSSELEDMKKENIRLTKIAEEVTILRELLESVFSDTGEEETEEGKTTDSDSAYGCNSSENDPENNDKKQVLRNNEAENSPN